MRPVRRVCILLIVLMTGAAACVPATPIPVADQSRVGTTVNATLTANAFFTAATAATLPAIATVTPNPAETQTATAPATAQDPAGAGQPSSTPVPTLTSGILPAGASQAPLVGVSVATNCRSGPARSHDWLGGLYPGQTAKVVAQYPDLNYWIIENPSGSGTCWLWGGYATISGDTSSLPVWPAPTQPPMPRLTAKVKLACRTAPNDSYEKAGSLDAGESVEIVGMVIGSDWWLIDNPDAAGTCWFPGREATISGNLKALPIVTIPAGVPQPTATGTIIIVPEGYSCKIVSTDPDSGVILAANTSFNTTWKIKNTGTKTWKPDTVDYRYLSGARLAVQKLYDLPSAVAPGETINLQVSMTAPKDDGRYSATWGLTQNGEVFCQMAVSVRVK